MAYSLDDKISGYLSDQGITGARVAEMTIILPLAEGEMHRRIQGVVTSEKLDAIVSEWKAKRDNAA